ncbi:hypothetical protein SAMN02949497_1237 [Methylomagnum ishizawai]|uniref:RelA/SpoT domain-containing protein n=1 Tax=Methylomagnum ishizawai TaxID=1760988 RepID=A0A1Y6CU36_9GAMM|nr:hypothetical protein [Methylomagnum ishizawai]SMF93941.1 hypothetical protein SAMN02949497_1237 [Methylomagnum ishizawai]
MKTAQSTPTALPGDELYFRHPEHGVMPGKVLSAGTAGCVVHHAKGKRRVPWEDVQGHRKRAEHALKVVDRGEDGFLAEDKRGRRVFVRHAEKEGGDNGGKAMMKAIPILFLKSHVKGYIRGDGTYVHEYDDKRQKKLEPPRGSKLGYGTHNIEPGDTLHFGDGGMSGRVHSVGEQGATVHDERGGIHKVEWHDVKGFKAGNGGGGGSKPPADPGNGGRDKSLFGDVSDLPEDAFQPHNTENELYASAEKALPKFKKALANVAEIIGGKVSGSVEEALGAKGPAIVVAPLKGKERARQKVRADYAGKWKKLRDVLRASIKCDTVEELHKVVEGLKASGIQLAKAPKDRFQHPTPEGYRDALLIVKVPGSDMLAEIQLHLSHILAAKSAGHEHYNVIRDIHAKYGTDTGLEDHWHEEDKSRYRHAQSESKRLYAEAWDRAKGLKQNLQKSIMLLCILKKGKRKWFS